MKLTHARRAPLAFMAVAALGLNALGIGAGSAGGAAAATGPCGTATGSPPAHFDHVVLLIFENKNQDQILSGTAAPYLKGLAQQCGRATDMNTPDPLTSLANYIALTSGYTGHPKHITANRGPDAWPQDSVSIFEQLGGDWTELAESAPSKCYTGSSAFNFTVNHTPAPYYTRLRSQCQAHDIPMGSTPDLSAAFTLLSPNKSHIMHEDDAPGTTSQTQRIKAGDSWAAGYLPKVFASPQYQAGRTVLIITWDEGTSKRTDVPFIVVSPYTHPGYTTAAHLTHYSTLKGMEQMLGLPLLGHAGDAGVASIRDYFGLS
jgi:phosphatidylinositol-3-phosphatase